MLPVSELYLSMPGVICAAGNSVDELWRSVIEGNQKGIKEVYASNGKKFLVAKINDENLPSSKAKYDMRIMRIEENALLQIQATVERAKELYGADRIAVCIGSCDNGTEFSVSGHKQFFSGNGFPKNYSLEIQGADYVATFAKELYNLSNVAITFSSACASSASAFIKAAELIRAGMADAAIVGGVDIASDTVLQGFDSLEAVSSEVTNPFSKNRKGITLGEGAAFFVLAKDASVVAGDGVPCVTLAGYGESADAYHITAPEPEGIGAETAMRDALAMAGVTASDIGYLNLHGTGTKHNDSMESKAVSRVFGDYAVPCSSTKPMTGHTLGVASAIEAAVCWAVLANDWLANTKLAKNAEAENVKLPLHVYDGIADEELPQLAFVRSSDCDDGKVNIKKSVRYCMSNSFAFGGANVSLIFGKL